MSQKKVILHINNWAKIGGVPCFILDFARTFPEFLHYMCSMNPGEDDEFVKYLENMGVKYFHAPKITRDIIERLKPVITVLHNIGPDKMGEQYPYDIFYDTKVIMLHHNVLKPIKNIYITLNWYVSDYIKGNKMGLCFIPVCIQYHMKIYHAQAESWL